MIRATRFNQLINWDTDSTSIYNQIRALSNSPCAFTFLNNKRVKIFSAKISDSMDNNKSIPGQINIVNNNIFVYTLNSAIQICELQLEGKSRMACDKFILGHRNLNGMYFG